MAGMIAVPFDKECHRRFLGPINALDQCDVEVAVGNIQDFHAAAGIVGQGIVDPLDQGAAFNLDVEPGPALDRTMFHCVCDVVHFP